MSGHVDSPHGPAWLRVLVAAPGTVPDLLRDGAVSAAVLDGQGVAKPRLLGHVDFDYGEFVCRAELSTPVDEPTVSAGEVLQTDPRLPDAWWAGLRASLTALAAVPTGRCPRTQQQIDRVLGTVYGPDLDTTVHTWATAHGDLRWSNLTARTPVILDWEFWGTAPVGTDAATLYCTSLLVPDVADEIRHRFADVLDTSDGRLAQLGIIAQLLRHPDRADLAVALRVHAAGLGHPVRG
ncbi:hypothetical protein ACPA54_32195 [Uniformispora flossi]|uniref:hypothetical protein n=1 Tax=Uniformispora flossi TaxID=3390723 RepID=UPI003C2AEBD1